MHFRNDNTHGDNHSKQHESGLQCIGPYNGLNTTFQRIKLYQKHKKHHGYPKRNTIMIKDKELQNAYHQIHAKRSTNYSRKQKKQGAGFVGCPAKALAEVRIYRGQVKPIIDRQQNGTNDGITCHITQHNDKIGKVCAAHPARNGDKRHTRQRSANHPVSHYRPGRFTVTDKKALVVSFAGSPPRNKENKKCV